MTIENLAVDANCEFCAKFGVTPTRTRQWYDSELVSSPRLAVVPTLGALTVGSVMLVTRMHYPSMAAAPIDIRTEAVAVASRLTDFLRQRFGQVLLFEHGSAPGAAKGGCISHAHWQLAPAPVDVYHDILKERSADLVSAGSLSTVLPRANGPYLLIKNSEDDQVWTGAGSGLPGQYVRMKIAAATNQPECWDYVAYPHYDRIESTIAIFSNFR